MLVAVRKHNSHSIFISISMRRVCMKKFSKKLTAKFFPFFVSVFLLFAVNTTTVSAAGSVNKPVPAKAGKFIQTNNRWHYRYKDGTLAKKTFLLVDGQTYYINSSGNRWYGWHTIHGKQYYFGLKDEGFLYKKRWLILDGDYYCLGKDGVPRTGWVTASNGRRYYLGADGKAYKGTHTIDGVSYQFNSKAVLVSWGAKLSVSSDCALLINADTGKVLFSKNADKRHANASTTKILTGILALENAELTDKVKISSYAASQEPTKLYMQAGQIFYLKDLMYSLLVPSHNDTAVAIAEHVSGTVPKFLKLMNKKAASLGCTDTHFETPNGLDSGYNHYTTCNDLAKIARYALKNKTFCKIVGTRSYEFRSISKDNKYYHVFTTNQLLGNLNGVIGVKTGYTSKAGHCFVGAVKTKSGDTCISVTLGAPTSEARWNDASRLLTYARDL